MVMIDIHTEEELLRKIEQDDEWFEDLDLNSLECITIEDEEELLSNLTEYD